MPWQRTARRRRLTKEITITREQLDAIMARILETPLHCGGAAKIAQATGTSTYVVRQVYEVLVELGVLAASADRPIVCPKPHGSPKADPVAAPIRRAKLDGLAARAAAGEPLFAAGPLLPPGSNGGAA